jgi:hypothetical protein
MCRVTEKLEPCITRRPIPYIEIYDQVTQVGMVDRFSSLVGTFLRHFKNGGHQIDDCTIKEDENRRLKRMYADLEHAGRFTEGRHRTFQTWLAGEATPTPRKLEEAESDPRHVNRPAQLCRNVCELGSRSQGRSVEICAKSFQ